MDNEKCAGCTSLLKDECFLECYRCSDKYHYICVNYKKKNSGEVSVEFKETWVCPLCRSKEPKLGNNCNTPVRIGANANLHATIEATQVQLPPPPPPPVSAAILHDNVTTHAKPHRSCNCSYNISADIIRDIMREELNRKYNFQFTEFQQKLNYFEESFIRENERQKTLTTDLLHVSHQLHAVVKDLTSGVNLLLERRSHISVADARSSSAVPVLPTSAATDEGSPAVLVLPTSAATDEGSPAVLVLPTSATTDESSVAEIPQQRRRRKNDILIYSSNNEQDILVPGNEETESASELPENLGHTTKSSQDMAATAKPSDIPAQEINCARRTEIRRKTVREWTSRRCTAGLAVTALRAVEPRKYIHLWNMLSNADEIKQYLDELYPRRACTVQELKTKNSYNSFKIGVPDECFDECCSVDIWPENARVKKWVNHKKRATERRSFQSELGGQHAV